MRYGEWIGGGATLPGSSGRLNASIPLARPRVDQSGVTILLRPRWFGALLARMQIVEASGDTAGWSASWHEIDHVLVARRSVVFVLREARGARFVTPLHRRLQPLLATLQDQGIAVSRQFTTIGKTFTI